MNIKIGDQISVSDKFMMTGFDAIVHELLQDPSWIIVKRVTDSGKYEFGLCHVYVDFTSRENKSPYIPNSIGIHFRCMNYGNTPEEVIEARNEWELSQAKVIKRLNNGN